MYESTRFNCSGHLDNTIVWLKTSRDELHDKCLKSKKELKISKVETI